MLFKFKVKFLHRQSPGQQCLQYAVLILTSQLGLSVVPMLTVKLGGVIISSLKMPPLNLFQRLPKILQEVIPTLRFTK